MPSRGLRDYALWERWTHGWDTEEKLAGEPWSLGRQGDAEKEGQAGQKLRKMSPENKEESRMVEQLGGGWCSLWKGLWSQRRPPPFKNKENK